MITTFEVERRYAQMRAAMLRREADGYPEGSQERQDALYRAWMQQERADRYGQMISLTAHGANELFARRRAREAADSKNEALRKLNRDQRQT